MTSGNWQVRLLQEHGLRPKRSLSQNFLIDESYLARIAQAAELDPLDSVLEVGPGLGGLTRQLAARAGRVLAVEIDEELAALLKSECRDLPNVHFAHGDILTCDLEALWAEADRPCSDLGFRVVANLPYHAANRILMRLLDGPHPRPSRLTVLVQDDVAERICARPGSMSLLGLGAQFYAECRVLLRIPGGAFLPQPKVRSALVDLRVLETPRLSPEITSSLFALARLGFGQRRKQLGTVFSRSLGLQRDELRRRLDGAGVSPARRAETLSVEDWIRVAETLPSPVLQH